METDIDLLVHTRVIIWRWEVDPQEEASHAVRQKTTLLLKRVNCCIRPKEQEALLGGCYSYTFLVLVLSCRSPDIAFFGLLFCFVDRDKSTCPQKSPPPHVQSPEDRSDKTLHPPHPLPYPLIPGSLLFCPDCGTLLNLPKEGESLVTCEQCAYEEPASCQSAIVNM